MCVQPSRNRPKAAPLVDLIQPLCELELVDALAGLLPSVAPGPDSWLTVPVIRKIRPNRLRLLLNFWLVTGSIP